jgi:ATP-binding cassette, subfamily B, bacterial
VIRFLARLIAGRSRPYLLLVILWIVMRVTILATGLLLQAFFDALGGPGRAGFTVWSLVAILAANEAARLVLWYGVIMSRVEPGYTYSVRAGLQDSVVRNVLRRPAATALDRPAGDVISRLGGDSDEVGVFAVWSASNISRLVIAAAALVIMVRISPLATAGLVVPVVVVTLTGRALNARVGRYRAAARAAAGEVSTIVGEMVSGMQALKVARAEPRMIERLRQASEARRRAEVRDEVFLSLQQSVFRSTAALGTALVLLLVTGQMRTGSFTVGDLALFVFYIQFVAQAVNALGMFMGRTRRAALSLERIGEIAGGADVAARCEPVYLTGEPPPPLPAPDREPLRELRVTGLEYRYSGSDRGVHGVNLRLTAGTVTLVTGRVGAGKSTLLKAILGLLPAQAGEIRWNDRAVADPAGFFVPPRTAYLPQVPRLFSGTLRENVLLGLDREPGTVLDAIRAAAFQQDLDAMPDGLDTVIGPRGMRLSGGQIQRIAAARMIIRDSELMLLDDASNALDVDTERELWASLRRTGRTLLAVSHRPQLLTSADHLVVLDGGTVVAAGTPEQVRDQHPELLSGSTTGPVGTEVES